jgi:hypothetical protein
MLFVDAFAVVFQFRGNVSMIKKNQSKNKSAFTLVEMKVSKII